MSDLSRGTVIAGQKLVVHNDTAADACSQRHGNHIVCAPARTGVVFAESGAVGVIADISGFAEAFFQNFLGRHIVKKEVGGIGDDAFCRLYRSGRA